MQRTEQMTSRSMGVALVFRHLSILFLWAHWTRGYLEYGACLGRWVVRVLEISGASRMGAIHSGRGSSARADGTDSGYGAACAATRIFSSRVLLDPGDQSDEQSSDGLRTNPAPTSTVSGILARPNMTTPHTSTLWTR